MPAIINWESRDNEVIKTSLWLLSKYQTKNTGNYEVLPHKPVKTRRITLYHQTRLNRIQQKGMSQLGFERFSRSFLKV